MKKGKGNFAIIPEGHWSKNPRCPHCFKPANRHFDLIKECEELDRADVEIMKCPSCKHPYAILSYPWIRGEKTIYLSWEEKKRVLAQKEEVGNAY